MNHRRGDGATGRRGDPPEFSPSPRLPVSPSEAQAAKEQKATLRDVRAADLEALYRLDQACFEPGIAYSRSELRRFLALPTAEALVLEEREQIVAFAIGYRPRRSLASLVTLDVDAEHRRRGAGRRLLSELFSRWQRAGVSAVVLEVDVANDSAIAFYERLGFRRAGRLTDYYGEGRDAFEMVLTGLVP